MLQDQATVIEYLGLPGVLTFKFDGRGYEHRPVVVSHPGGT
jgi:hypothetical protein